MSSRLILIGLAVVLALGASIYFGMRAGAPVSKTEPLRPEAVAKAEPAKKSPSGTFKGTPSPLPLRKGTAPLPAPAGAPAEPAMDQQQILAALKQLDLLSDGADKQQKRHDLVALLAALDPLQALNYVATLADAERAQQRVNVLSIWAGTDPIAATLYFRDNSMPGGIANDEDRSMAAAIAKVWAGKDTPAAWAWVTSLPLDVRALATAEVVARMAESDPQAALSAVTSLPSDAERATAMQPLAVEWGKSAPVVAAAWVSGLQSEIERNYAASGLVTGWMTSSPRSASEWVSQLPLGNTRDSAIVAMVDAPTSMKNPEATLTWAANIQNVELRNQILPEVLKRWQVQDPAGAASFITKHSKKK
jgi:hypothetical protein